MPPAENHRAVGEDLCAGYAAMAADEARERDAWDWAEGPVADEPRAHD